MFKFDEKVKNTLRQKGNNDFIPFCELYQEYYELAQISFGEFGKVAERAIAFIDQAISMKKEVLITKRQYLKGSFSNEQHNLAGILFDDLSKKITRASREKERMYIEGQYGIHLIFKTFKEIYYSTSACINAISNDASKPVALLLGTLVIESDDIKVQEELNEVRCIIDSAGIHSAYEIMGVSFNLLRKISSSISCDIVHIAGHGSEHGTLELVDRNISGNEFSILFYSQNPSLIFVNTCYAIRFSEEIKCNFNICITWGPWELMPSQAVDYAKSYYGFYACGQDFYNSYTMSDGEGNGYFLITGRRPLYY